MGCIFSKQHLLCTTIICTRTKKSNAIITIGTIIRRRCIGRCWTRWKDHWRSFGCAGNHSKLSGNAMIHMQFWIWIRKQFVNNNFQTFFPYRALTIARSSIVSLPLHSNWIHSFMAIEIFASVKIVKSYQKPIPQCFYLRCLFEFFFRSDVYSIFFWFDDIFGDEPIPFIYVFKLRNRIENTSNASRKTEFQHRAF